MFEKFDGTGRSPRPVQIKALKWLEDNWIGGPKFLAINLPTGGGKSFLARSIINEFGDVAYLAPNNVLIDQIIETYPLMNSLIGANHYKCKEDPAFTCRERAKLGENHCGACPYQDALSRATSGEATAFNPLSYYYMRMRKGWEPPKVIVIDEAHSFSECIKTLVSFKLSKQKYKYPDTLNVLDLIEWSKEQIKTCEKVFTLSTNARMSRAAYSKYDKLIRMHHMLSKFQQEYSIFHEKDGDDEILVLEPLNVPSYFMEEFLAVEKVVLLSATLTRYSVEQITCGTEYAKIELESPIDSSQRPVYYRPSGQPMNANTPPSYLAHLIRKTREEFPGNCICHVTYAVAEQLRPFFPEALIHTKTTKKSTLKRFKVEGGLWLAAGCDEGIDLPDDACRTNIILRLPRPNTMDLTVAKRKALEGGQEWYDIQTLIKAIQQAGRSTRHETDSSSIIICDPYFKRLVDKYRDQLPKSFLESIQWRKTNGK